MKISAIALGVVLWFTGICSVSATSLYVDVNGTNPISPYSTWSTAAKDIQSAIDAADDGDQILVTNGIYQTGGRVAYGLLTNRVAVIKPVIVQSVNGPAATIIQGYQVPGVTNGNTAIRCVYLTNNAALIGFTVVGGATRDDGGSGAAINLNGGGIYCESGSAIVSNCVVIGNAARVGGGVSSGTLNGCLISSNSAVGMGGGTTGGTLNNCAIIGNHARQGGGASLSTLNGCQLTGNQATTGGGGASGGILNNCAFTANLSTNGGGADSATLNNCTLTGNFAQSGGGASRCVLNNCIIDHNFASIDANYGTVPFSNCTLNYCCSTPLATNGTGNIAVAPQLADFVHISGSSPCRGAGSSAYVSGTDIDGEPWNNPPSIGCDEYVAGSITGALSVAISAVATNVAAGYAISFTGQISGHASSNVWNFGDGIMVANQPYLAHSWVGAGDYNLVLSAFNDSNPGGISATVTVHVLDHPIHYVSLVCTNPAPPYLSWSTAATNIQDAVDASYPGALVLVTNGVYQTGGRVIYGALTNRLAITKPVPVQSVNGAAFTMIQGYQVPGKINGCGSAAVRCVYLTNNASLTGFTLTNGATTSAGDLNREESGGGAWCESTNSFLASCILVANSSFYAGGGAYSGTLSNCLLTTNLGGGVSFAPGGGGAAYSVLQNCVLSLNKGTNDGGGAANCILSGCWVSNNACVINGGGMVSSVANGCVIANNWALGGNGGGAYVSTLNDCLVLNNWATNGGTGGGVRDSFLNNCTVTGNGSSNAGGGAAGGTLNNCVIFNNTSTKSTSSNYNNLTLNYCCTQPLPGAGAGNLTNVPLFVNPAVGDFHLQSGSPCINSGDNAYVTVTTDLDGNPRIQGVTVDIGAYGYQTPSSILSYAWAQQYGLPTDGSADYLDLDGTGMKNWQKSIAGLNPTNAASVLAMVSPTATNKAAGFTVSWQSVNTRMYYLQRTTNLAASAFTAVQSNIVGQAGTTSFTDTSATNDGPYFYRVGVQ